jgi:hypothetical protein
MLAQLNLNTIEGQALGGKVPANPAALIGDLLPYVFGAAGIALLIYLILGGFQMMLAKGDPKAIQGAQSKITSALIGFVIVFVSYFLVQILGQLFGIQNTLFGQIFK